MQVLDSFVSFSVSSWLREKLLGDGINRFQFNHFFSMEEFKLDSPPTDCISCVRFAKKSNLLAVSSWDRVGVVEFLLICRPFLSTTRIEAS